MESEDITMEYIYNLFSNFGDITKMILIKKKNTCLIEYESINYSSYAKEYLNNVVFFSNPLKVKRKIAILNFSINYFSRFFFQITKKSVLIWRRKIVETKFISAKRKVLE